MMTDEQKERLRELWENIRGSHKYLKWAFSILIAFAVGFLVCWYVHVQTLATQLADARAIAAWYKSCLLSESKDTVQVSADVQNGVTAAYVPKERIAYTDAHGRRVETVERTDVQMQVAAPTIAVKYNGKTYDMPGIQGEKTKFEKGKLQSQVTTQATVDLTDVIDEAAKARAAKRDKHFSVGAYGTTEGVVMGFGYQNKQNGIDVLVNPIEPERFLGVGYRRAF
ncbi:hypothetical protein [Selenomonas sp. F0473]|uniref:hypothetical protein n=1 Tax=Selenomonas sp. F0473 TaxID=999423 RepID=UPI0025D1EB2C|nr:hypothetical protein [Selenomonas sp. F0473]